MIRLELTRGSSGILTQSFSEVCEHCDEKVTPIDLADIITKKPNDPRTLKIRDKNNNLYTLKTKGARIEEIKVEARKKQLLDDSGEELKYGIRAERMCSESIDTINGVTASFCYRTTSEKFLAKKSGSVSFASKFNASDEIEHTEEGQKLGMDRKGNVIRLAAYKRIDMETGTAIDTDAQQKYEGPYKTLWFRSIKSADDRKYLITASQAVTGWVRQFGTEAKDMTVVARVRSRAEFVNAVNKYVGRGETSLR